MQDVRLFELVEVAIEPNLRISIKGRVTDGFGIGSVFQVAYDCLKSPGRMETEDVGTWPVGNASVETELGGRFRLRDVNGPSEFPESSWKRLGVEQVFRLTHFERFSFVVPVPVVRNQFAHLFRAKRESSVAGPVPEKASQNLDIPVRAAEGGSDEVKTPRELLQVWAEREAVVLND